MLLTRLALPAMLARNHGHIVNIASISGLLPTGWGEVYSATKHGLVGFTRSLRMTLQVKRSQVKTSLICPGFVEDVGMYADRDFAAESTAPRLVGTSPSAQVAQAVIDSLKYGRSEIVISLWQTRLLCAVYNLAPRFYDWVICKVKAHRVFSEMARGKHRVGQIEGAVK